MTCATCQNCITTTTVISPSIAVDTYHCMIHDLPVEPTDYCEDYRAKLEA